MTFSTSKSLRIGNVKAGVKIEACCGAKGQLEQLSMIKECIVLLCCCSHIIYGHNQGLFT
jgi:hypothetical protein